MQPDKPAYNQLKAMLAITKASASAAFRSPQNVFFSLFFPIVLIVIFGSLGGGGGASVDVAFEKNVDTNTMIYKGLSQVPVLKFHDRSKEDVEDLLRKGRITAIINISKKTDSLYDIHLKTSSASRANLPVLQSVLRNVIHYIDQQMFPDRSSVAVLSEETIPGRKYKRIDFLLPGMIGFSLIGAAIFGVAFSFYSLRETLVLKRMYSTPISKVYIVLGEGLARVIFQMTTVLVLIAFGYFMYDFTLANGLITFINMLILSFIGLVVFMGFGFVISGVAKNQNVIPIYANLFMFPQYFLSGTFFPKSSLPAGMQSVISFLPLTALNDAMRNVAFEGSSLWSCWRELSILAVWGILIYAIATRFFKWE
jgi:ABC-2 type transport system permease protein